MSDILQLSKNWKTTATAMLCLASSIAYIISKQRKRKDGTKPEKWIRVGTVSKLIIYPVKSTRGVEVEKALTTNLGLQGINRFNLRDRIFMVTNKSYFAQTQRMFPSMALIEVEALNDEIILSAPNMEKVSVKPPEELPSNKKKARVYKDDVEVLDCGDEVGAWLDKYLGKDGHRLVYHAQSKSQRKLIPELKEVHTFSLSDTGALSDEAAFMILTKESIQELNKHVTDYETSERNFRPSILVQGSVSPFSEDFWGYVRIGEEGPILKGAKPCVRCVMTTVDPATGTFNKNKEPLVTLKKLQRQVGDEEVSEVVKGTAVFGLQCGLFSGEGAQVAVGDPVYAALL